MERELTQPIVAHFWIDERVMASADQRKTEPVRYILFAAFGFRRREPLPIGWSASSRSRSSPIFGSMSVLWPARINGRPSRFAIFCLPRLVFADGNLFRSDGARAHAADRRPFLDR